MNKPALTPSSDEGPWYEHPVARAALIVALLYLFLVGIDGLGGGFRSLGEDLIESFFQATENPFVGLMMGILATTLVQSSSVTTSSIVGLVAAPDNPLPIANAIPMVMGANIGTTVTNTIASLGHIRRTEEFRRAFAVATCHDFFNYMAVLVLLPVELMTGILGRTAAALTAQLKFGLGGEFDSPIKGAIDAGGELVGSIAHAVLADEMAAFLHILLSGLLIVAALMSIVRVMRSAMHRRVEAMVSRALGNHALVAMALGMVATVMVQSSSITTSLLVPLAGAGVLTLAQAFPVTLGANVGTTMTALLAAMAATGESAAAGLTIAFVHLFFNLAGTALIYPYPPIRELPLKAARKLADVATRSRRLAVVYVLVMFYLLPALFAALSR